MEDKDTSQILKIEIYTQLAIVYAKSGDGSAAKELIQETIIENADGKHKDLLILANCEINILNNDIKTAVEILKNVEVQDSSYEIAKIKLSKIYLNILKQPRAFTQCYLDIAEKSPNKKNLLLLGNAFQEIQEYDQAQKIFMRIEQKYGKEKDLSLKIAKCYKKLNNFLRALEYLEYSLEQFEDNFELKLELCEVLLKMDEYEIIGNYFTRADLKEEDNLDESQNFSTKKKSLERSLKVALLLCEVNTKHFQTTKEQRQIKIALSAIQKVISKQRQIIELAKNENLEVSLEKKKLS